jgi:hypothetical protein
MGREYRRKMLQDGKTDDQARGGGNEKKDRRGKREKISVSKQH